MRIISMVCACALAVFVSESGLAPGALGQEAITGMSGGPPTAAEPGAVPLPAAERDPAERSARATECAQRADAQGLEGKIRKHFLHKCRSSL